MDVITFPENLLTTIGLQCICFIAWRYFTPRRDVIMIKEQQQKTTTNKKINTLT